MEETKIELYRKLMGIVDKYDKSHDVTNALITIIIMIGTGSDEQEKIRKDIIKTIDSLNI